MSASSLTVREPSAPYLISTEPNVLAQLLADKRSPNTKRAYAKDLRDFFRYLYAVEEPTSKEVQAFLRLDRFQALSVVLRYKAHLRDERKLAEATVNRRLAAIKSLVRLGNQLGQCTWTLSEVKGDKVVRYRDTTGISKEQYRKLSKNWV